MGTSSPPSRQQLTRTRIAQTALAIIDRDGLDALTMRALGQELGVNPMAVYHHLPSKADLFDAVAEEAWGKLELPPATGDWQSQVRALAWGVRDLLREHPQALPLLSTRSSGAQGLRILDHGISVLTEAGMPARDAFVLLSGAASMIIGHALAEVGPPPGGASGPTDDAPPDTIPRNLVAQLPHLASALQDDEPPSWDETFERALDALIQGAQSHRQELK